MGNQAHLITMNIWRYNPLQEAEDDAAMPDYQDAGEERQKADEHSATDDDGIGADVGIGDVQVGFMPHHGHAVRGVVARLLLLLEEIWQDSSKAKT